MDFLPSDCFECYLSMVLILKVQNLGSHTNNRCKRLLDLLGVPSEHGDHPCLRWFDTSGVFAKRKGSGRPCWSCDVEMCHWIWEAQQIDIHIIYIYIASVAASPSKFLCAVLRPTSIMNHPNRISKCACLLKLCCFRRASCCSRTSIQPLRWITCWACNLSKTGEDVEVTRRSNCDDLGGLLQAWILRTAKASLGSRFRRLELVSSRAVVTEPHDVTWHGFLLVDLLGWSATNTVWAVTICNRSKNICIRNHLGLFVAIFVTYHLGSIGPNPGRSISVHCWSWWSMMQWPSTVRLMLKMCPRLVRFVGGRTEWCHIPTFNKPKEMWAEWRIWP